MAIGGPAVAAAQSGRADAGHVVCGVAAKQRVWCDATSVNLVESDALSALWD